MFLRRLAAAVLLSVACGPAAAAEITVFQPVARASLGRVPNTVAYMTLRNTGAGPDRLLSAACTCAAKVEVHGHRMQNGVARMYRMEALPIPARGGAVLRPGGAHLMLLGLKRPLKAGETIELGLRFERAGTVRARVPVSDRIETQAHHAH